MFSNDLVRAHVIAHGRVQGVFYRDTMRRAAESREVSGSAVNRRDGTVECFFEGARIHVAEMIELARDGPPLAEVTRLDIEWTAPCNSSGFTTA